MSKQTHRLTMAQALVQHLVVQRTEIDGRREPLFAGLWAIFGHGNVPALGEALHAHRASLPTWRGQNEQSMVHIASAYAKQMRRRRMMAVTSSVGPGASNLLTGAATAYVNRLPVLLLPGDTLASRAGAPVLQEVERPDDGTLNVNDCFRPVSNWFDRLQRPEQLITSLPRAISVLTDPELAGPATLCLPQDVQAETFDYPDWFFEPVVHRLVRTGADARTLDEVAARLRSARRPVIVAGGGVHYSFACQALQDFAQAHGIPVVETSAGKGALPAGHALNAGGVGVVGASSANAIVQASDLVIAIGTRLSDFTTGSRSVLSTVRVPQININVAQLDAHKHAAIALRSDARRALEELSPRLQGWSADAAHREALVGLKQQWQDLVDTALQGSGQNRPSDAQVTDVLNRHADQSRDVLVVAAGSMPAEGVKLWGCEHSRGYHAEYGFSCMGYELAGGIGVKMAERELGGEAEVFVVVGDGSYLMMNSEILTSVALGQKLVILVLDNRGFGCINRLQGASGQAPFNNLLDDGTAVDQPYPKVDFAAHAAALGAAAEQVDSLDGLTSALQRARASERTYCIAIDTNAVDATGGGSWWQVGIPEVSVRESVTEARRDWQDAHRDEQAF